LHEQKQDEAQQRFIKSEDKWVMYDVCVLHGIHNLSIDGIWIYRIAELEKQIATQRNELEQLKQKDDHGASAELQESSAESKYNIVLAALCRKCEQYVSLQSELSEVTSRLQVLNGFYSNVFVSCKIHTSSHLPLFSDGTRATAQDSRGVEEGSRKAASQDPRNGIATRCMTNDIVFWENHVLPFFHILIDFGIQTQQKKCEI
jgi:hypothetical protein